MPEENEQVPEDQEELKRWILRKLSEAEEIDPYQYDASYELVKKACEVYADSFPKKVSYHDLNLFYYLTVNVRPEIRRRRIELSSLSESAQEELFTTLRNTTHKRYCEDPVKGNYGMFSLGVRTFGSRNGVSQEDVGRVIKLFADLTTANTRERKYELVKKAYKQPVRGYQNGSSSQILHCFDPYTFPVLNGHLHHESIYVGLGVKGIPKERRKRNNLTRYIEFCEAIRLFEEDTPECSHFSNYRVFDRVEKLLPREQSAI